ncbi:PTS sugar transporter subunit IIA [Terribacillus saccharophilus]|uniref:PTS sugar transporter subunit IIA n=1 Tax=Terribacillus saccharophilus TaxID=361277 RepID=UPI000C9AF6B9|nr:PTS glucose transporter subunit IIA [Terribacillus goriensis]
MKLSKMFKKETKTLLYAPIEGKVVPIEEVPDEVFSQKMMGDGIAIIPSSGKVVAPADCKVEKVFETKHAIALTTDDGLELLIHVGIDTVGMKGDGFHVSVRDGQKLKAGEELMEFDIEKIQAANLNPITPVLILNPENAGTIQKSYAANALPAVTEVLAIKN